MQQQPYSQFDRPDFDRPMFDNPNFDQHFPPSQPPQAHAAPAQPSFDYSYGQEHRPSSFADVPPPSNGQTKPSRFRVAVLATKEIFRKRWQRFFFLIMIVQAIILIAFESYTYYRFNDGLNPNVWDEHQGNGAFDRKISGQLKAIPTFLILFILGFVYESWLAWDALKAKNTIQVIGIVIANAMLLVYATIQIDDIREAIDLLKSVNAFDNLNIWNEIKPLLIAIPCIIGAVTVLISWLAWKLYQDFAWDILKVIGADYRMKKRFLHYQVYISLLKFDFFFFIGFTIQFLVVVNDKGEVEQTLTAIAVPITVLILLCAAWFTRREWKIGMLVVMVLYLGALAYFIFKLSRIYDPNWGPSYKAVGKSLTAFAAITILLILLTLVNGMICYFNFGKGLKQHINAPRVEVDKDQVSYSLNDVKSTQPSNRMTID